MNVVLRGQTRLINGFNIVIPGNRCLDFAKYLYEQMQENSYNDPLIGIQLGENILNTWTWTYHDNPSGEECYYFGYMCRNRSKKITYAIPNLYDGCTIPEGRREKIPHFHCPICGAISTIHCLSGEGKSECTGCDSCLFGEIWIGDRLFSGV